MSSPLANISLSDARQMVEKSVAAARALGVPCSIAVVDASGHLLCFARQDGAITGSAELAINKAFTVQIFNTRTDTLNALAQPGAELYGIQHSHGGRVVVFGGGIPIQYEARAIGAIGVSGGTVAEDIAIAEAAVTVTADMLTQQTPSVDRSPMSLETRIGS
ncbi:GlcG/HbpS family heme-binding protein [Tabrizicola sp.]|uniref:GlcG/HbpS family heme-binding protein n=1 Tax=Tabrizicola sp. TaxID=2005166 RepID=UPI003F3CC8BD